MKREHIVELKLNRIKNPCLSCVHLHCKIDKGECVTCNKNNGNIDNFKEREQ